MEDIDIFEEEIFYNTPDGIKICARISKKIKKEPMGNIIMVHGLNNDMDEDGSFIKLSVIFNKINKKRYNTLRFDFRGHWDSEGKTEDVTINGELIDLETSIKKFDEIIGVESKYIIIASSFGAVASILYILKNEEKIEKLVLWNPVLDLEKTFLNAITPWGKTFFNPTGYEKLRTKGYITIPETDFRIGRELVQEFKKIKPYQLLSQIKIPVLTIHGTKDVAVPFEISKKYGIPNEQSQFIAHDCEHTFIGMVGVVIEETFEWITTGKISNDVL
ncbi:MAG: alpha/beta hydrolase [Bacteroidota bacterium]